jgi:acetoin utilization deacetylase AcuC-like enzyme
VNVALPAGSGPAIYAESFRRLVLPVMEEFDAEVVLVSAGFDAHADDPLASMQLDAESYAAMATSLVRHAERAGHGRIGFVLEGGYDLGAIESSVEAVSRAALGEPTELPEASPEPAERAALERTLHALAPHWDCLHR